MFVFMNSEGNRYGVDSPLKHHYPFKGLETYTIINDFICEQNSKDDGYRVDCLLKHHYPLNDKQAYTIINVFVFGYKIQKDMEMDMVTRQVVWLTLYTHVAESGVSPGRLI